MAKDPVQSHAFFSKVFLKSLYLDERLASSTSFLSFLSGFEKVLTWKKLSGFSKSRRNFQHRQRHSGLNFYKLAILLGQKRIKPKQKADMRWILSALDLEGRHAEFRELINGSASIAEYCERGIINPFLYQIAASITQVSRESALTNQQIEIFTKSLLPSIEVLVRRSFILDLNVQEISGKLSGNNESQKYQSFVKSFECLPNRLEFFENHPVLFRMVSAKLENWVLSTTEFLKRLRADRALLQDEFGISENAELIEVHQSGDTHNAGRSVMVLRFSDRKSLIYKPRSTSLEANFQKYLNYFNRIDVELKLKTIKVFDKITYGWTEFVNFEDQVSEQQSDSYHFKLGVLVAIIFSINGVDIFFENLISSSEGPVVIDLETMFHNSIEIGDAARPTSSMQNILHSSVIGIGILPQPNIGATEDEVFDVSVMGAKKNARAPYKVTGIEKFGRSDMRVTEISGWIPDNKSSSEDIIPSKSKNRSVYKGLKYGFDLIYNSRKEISEDGGLLDSCFQNSVRRLIVRDTKVYGTMQQDETHPDLLLDQIDREWHWDNLWSATLERPLLSLFIDSELRQLKQGDIPYFYGRIDERYIFGADGERIDLSGLLNYSPLELAKNKIKSLDVDSVNDQIRIAATSLGIENLAGVTQPVISSQKSRLENITIISDFILARVKSTNNTKWLDVCFNPVPKAIGYDAVRITPCDPFMYEGASGIAMFLHDYGSKLSSQNAKNHAAELMEGILLEVAENQNHSASGFNGLSSVIYTLHRCGQIPDSPFWKFQNQIPLIMGKLKGVIGNETKMDFLLGLAGVSCAILPYVRTTNCPDGVGILKDAFYRLRLTAELMLQAEAPVVGMDYTKGLSHGISGVALALYRLSEFFDDDSTFDLVNALLMHERHLVKLGGWTDRHAYNGEPLVAWCHGSAGIALALSCMPKAQLSRSDLKIYFDEAFQNTLDRGFFNSKCLCHGSAGNLYCIAAATGDFDYFTKTTAGYETDLFENGFCSFGAAQTMSLGLFTGITGAGYYLLSQEYRDINCDFMTLS